MKTGHLFLSNTTKIRLNITERFHFPMVLKSSRWSVLTLSLGVAFPFFHAVDFAHAAETDVKKEKTHHSSSVDKATKKRVISVKTVTDQQHEQTESVIVTGTRSANRGARDSISPITVISSAQLQRTGETNLADALVRSDPSINMTAHGSDASALTSAIRMRGLSANEVLVLINGKRRHTTANMGSDVGPEYGTTPVDLNMIPANAIDHIEVLEDGAAAMYGSDAIAGVINIITKKQDHGLNLSGQTGANAYNGDGWQYQLNADGGLKLGNDGYIHISGQMYHTDHYIKRIASNQLVPVPEGSKLRVGANQYLSPGQTQYTGAYGQVSPYSDQRESTPEETRENLSIDWEKPIAGATSFYGLITYAHRHAESIQHYRYPGAAGLETLEMYPSGFSPVETINENDYAATLGVKGKHLFGFDWDVSTTYGADEDQIYTENSLNVGLLRSTCSTDPSALTYSSIGCGYSPRKARAETFRAAQWTNTADFRRRFNIAHTVPMTLAMGAEHRLETYQIDAGDPAAYEAGGFTGYSGLRPGNAGNWSRDIWAGYLDGDFRLTRNWELDFAGRFEHYTDVGNTENGKVSTRYNITKRIALRGTISTGFRAPSLAEENFSALNQSATGATAFLPTSSAVSRSLGASQLKPERSTNVSGGIVLEPVTGFHIEADVYQINLRDRIGIGGSLTNDDNGGPNSIAVANAIESLGGIYTASGQYSASYLANDASTRTQGVDIKADYQFRMRQYGNLLLSMGIDLNRTRLHHNGISANGTQYLNAQNIALLTQSYPRSKIILNAYYTVGHWDVNIRQTRFGQTTSLLTQQAMVTSATTCPYNSNTCFNKFVNSPLWVTDLEVGYRFNKKWHLAVGENNIFNVRPRRVNPANNYLGTNIYDDNSATVPFYGAYYYGRVNATF